MRAELAPEWASPVSRVIKSAFFPQRVHPAKPFSKPPLATRLSAAQEEQATSRGRQISNMRGKSDERSASAAEEDGKFEIGTGRSEERRVGKECRSRWSP